MRLGQAIYSDHPGRHSPAQTGKPRGTPESHQLETLNRKGHLGRNGSRPLLPFTCSAQIHPSPQVSVKLVPGGFDLFTNLFVST